MTVAPDIARDAKKAKREETRERVAIVDPRPVIRIVRGERHVAIDRGIEALSNDPDLYTRESVLAHVTRAATSEPGSGVVAGMPQIHRMAAETLGERLTRAARWERYDMRAEDWVATEPHELIVRGIAARKEWPKLRPLVGLIEAPALRPDGTVLDSTGYDAATGFLLVPTLPFPRVPACPSPDDARAALATLEDVFVDFPYARAAGRSVAIAGLLTIIARPAIKGATPGFLFDANTPGSGKSLQADVIAAIATGREAGIVHYPSDPRNADEELEKRLGALAMAGARIVNFDNIGGAECAFGGSAIEACLTCRGSRGFRTLGKSELRFLPWLAVMLGSGNNIPISRDCERRVMIARIVSPLENPERRPVESFRHPERAFCLFEWALANRARLVVAGLTLLRAFVVAGRPRLARTWASFEAWTHLIADAIVWAGGEDPLLCRPSAEQISPEKRALFVIVRDWARVDPTGQGITIKSLLSLLYPPERQRGRTADGSPLPPDGLDDLREALESLAPPSRLGAPPDGRQLGIALRRFKDSNVGGMRLEAPMTAGGGVLRWRVRAEADLSGGGAMGSMGSGGVEGSVS